MENILWTIVIAEGLALITVSTLLLMAYTIMKKRDDKGASPYRIDYRYDKYNLYYNGVQFDYEFSLWFAKRSIRRHIKSREYQP